MPHKKGAGWTQITIQRADGDLIRSESKRTSLPIYAIVRNALDLLFNRERPVDSKGRKCYPEAGE